MINQIDFRPQNSNSNNTCKIERDMVKFPYPLPSTMPEHVGKTERCDATDPYQNTIPQCDYDKKFRGETSSGFAGYVSADAFGPKNNSKICANNDGLYAAAFSADNLCQSYQSNCETQITFDRTGHNTPVQSHITGHLVDMNGLNNSDMNQVNRNQDPTSMNRRVMNCKQERRYEDRQLRGVQYGTTENPANTRSTENKISSNPFDMKRGSTAKQNLPSGYY